MSEYPKQFKLMKGSKAKKSAIPILKADDRTLVTLQVPKSIKNEFGAIVYVATKGNSNQYTIHHPLGITPWDGDEWVISASADIPILTGRLEHPSAVRFRQEVNDLRREAFLAIPERIYDVKESGLVIGDVPRSTFVHAAKKLSKAAWKQHHPTVQAVKGQKKLKPPPKEPRSHYITFIANDAKDAELQYSKFNEEWELEDGFEEEFFQNHPFETKGGVTANAPQVAFKGLKAVEAKNLPDAIMKAILGTTSEVRFVEKVVIREPPREVPEEKVPEDIDLTGIRLIADCLRAIINENAPVTEGDVSVIKKPKAMHKDFSDMVGRLEGLLHDGESDDDTDSQSSTLTQSLFD